jgi:hypothetical protein
MAGLATAKIEFQGMVERFLFQSSKLEIKIDLLCCWENPDETT